MTAHTSNALRRLVTTFDRVVYLGDAIGRGMLPSTELLALEWALSKSRVRAIVAEARRRRDFSAKRQAAFTAAARAAKDAIARSNSSMDLHDLDRAIDALDRAARDLGLLDPPKGIPCRPRRPANARVRRPARASRS